MIFERFHKVQAHQFFIVISIVLEVLYTLVRPPFQSPDEFNHFCRVVQIAQGGFSPEQQDNRLGGQIPVSLREFEELFYPTTPLPEYKVKSETIEFASKIPLNSDQSDFVDFPNTAYYSPVSYLPQSLTFYLLSKITNKIFVLYYGTKILTFLLYVFCMSFVIRTIPVARWLVTALILIPMNVYVVNSISADIVTNVASLALLALVLKYAFDDKPFTSLRGIAILFLAAVLIFTKIIYVALLLLLFLIPAAKFGSGFRKAVIISLVLLLSAAGSMLWSGQVMNKYITYDEYNPAYRDRSTLLRGADYHEQKQILSADPANIPKVVFNSLVNEPQVYLRSYIGHFGAFMDTPVPDWFYLTCLLCLLVIAFTTSGNKLKFKDRAVLICCAVLLYSLLVISLHLTWNEVGKLSMDNIQGRYLVPVFPLLLIGCTGGKKIKFRNSILVAGFVLLSNSFAIHLLHNRFIADVNGYKLKVTCDAENARGVNFVADDEYRILAGANKRIAGIKRSGNYSVLVQQDSSFILRTDQLHLGDIVDIHAYKKGKGGRLVVIGVDGDGRPFRWTEDKVYTEDENGWSKMKWTFKTPVRAEGHLTYFYVENNTPEKVYFDDISYFIRASTDPEN